MDVVHNIFKDDNFTTPYTKASNPHKGGGNAAEECATYVEHLPDTFIHAGHKQPFLDSWDNIVQHASRTLDRAATEQKPPPNARAARGDTTDTDTTKGTAPKKIRVSEDERYISKMNNIWIHTETSYLGEIAATSTAAHPGKDGIFHPPAKWEEGLKWRWQRGGRRRSKAVAARRAAAEQGGGSEGGGGEGGGGGGEGGGGEGG